MTLISVIMSVYNMGKEVGAAIKSIQLQDFYEWELVVVDDGSTDDTGVVLKNMVEHDERIKVLRNRHNLGLAASLNRALTNASGQLIARMDADDVCLPNRFTQQVSFLSQHPDIDVLGGGALELDAVDNLVGETYRRETHEELVANIYKENPFIHPSIMARRRFFGSLRGYDERWRRAQDYELWLRGYRDFRYHNLQVPLLYYHRREPDLRSAFYSAQALWCTAKREGKLPTCGWYVVRPLLKAVQAKSS